MLSVTTMSYVYKFTFDCNDYDLESWIVQKKRYLIEFAY